MACLGCTVPLICAQAGRRGHADTAGEACSPGPEDGEKGGVLKEWRKGMVIRCRHSKGVSKGVILLYSVGEKVSSYTAE